MKILVTGAAGYIGAAVCWKLTGAGHEVVGLDSRAYGQSATFPDGVKEYEFDLVRHGLTWLFQHRGPFDVVAHLAAESEIPKSFQDPAGCYATNVLGGMRLLQAMRDFRCRRLIFASTAAVYGEPFSIPIREADSLGPTNPYGASKLAFEQALRWYPEIETTTFRFFNVVGSTEHVWELPYHRTRLMGLAMDHATGTRPGPLTLNGRDFDTADGTCVRDYIHVDDVAQAFVDAVARAPFGNRVYNLGIGKGYTNLQVLKAVEEVSGLKVPVVDGPRRPGDPDILIADSTRAQRELGWFPRFIDLISMAETAWRWKP